MWAFFPTEVLWQSALAVIPLVLLVAAICRWLPNRPAVRHTLWLMVLLWPVAVLLLPSIDVPAFTAAMTTADETRSETEEPSTASTASTASIATNAAGAKQSALRLHKDLPLEPNLLLAIEAPSEPAAPSDVESSESCLPYAAYVDNGKRCLSSEITDLPVEHTAESTRDPSKEEIREGVSRTGPRSPQLLARASGPVGKLPDTLEPPSICLESTAKDGDQSDEPKGDPTDRLAKAEPAVAKLVSEQRLTDEPVSATPSAWREWLVGLLAVRDAVGGLPPMPASVWVLGIIFCIMVKTVRALRCRRYLRRAFAAPDPVRAMVSDTARTLGLRRVPRTLMIDEQISPMLYCWRRPRLILPTRLWSQLDDASRGAIVCHELAHLRRRADLGSVGRRWP